MMKGDVTFLITGQSEVSHSKSLTVSNWTSLSLTMFIIDKELKVVSKLLTAKLFGQSTVNGHKYQGHHLKPTGNHC